MDIGKLFPLFVLGFVAMAVMLRSIGDATLAHGLAFGIWSSPAWKNLTSEIGDVWGSRYLLGAAMAAVGLGTSFSVFQRHWIQGHSWLRLYRRDRGWFNGFRDGTRDRPVCPHLKHTKSPRNLIPRTFCLKRLTEMPKGGIRTGNCILLSITYTHYISALNAHNAQIDVHQERVRNVVVTFAEFPPGDGNSIYVEFSVRFQMQDHWPDRARRASCQRSYGFDFRSTARFAQLRRRRKSVHRMGRRAVPTTAFQNQSDGIRRLPEACLVRISAAHASRINPCSHSVGLMRFAC